MKNLTMNIVNGLYELAELSAEYLSTDIVELIKISND